MTTQDSRSPHEDIQEENNMSNLSPENTENTSTEENNMSENIVTEENTDVNNDVNTVAVEEEIEIPENETEEEKKERLEKNRAMKKAKRDLERWHNLLNTTLENFRIYITEEGSHCWAEEESPLVVTMGSGKDLERSVLHALGDNAVPMREYEAKAVVGKIFIDLEKAVRRGEVERVKKVNRFYFEKKTGASYIYTATPKSASEDICIRIDSSGITTADAPEGVVFENGADSMGSLEIDKTGTIKDFWDAFQYINIPSEDRMLALGWMVSPIMYPESARPGLLLRGPQGSGKSESAGRLKSLIDPDVGSKTKETMAPTGSKEDFMKTLVGCDTKIPGNLSGISGTFSDALAQTMTGVLYERNEKYSERQLKWDLYISLIFSTINIGMVIPRDLQSRIFPIDTPVIPEHIRAMGDIVEDKWEAILPKARYGLFKLISKIKKIMENQGEELEVNGFRMVRAAKAMSAAEIVLEEEGLDFTPWGNRYGDMTTKLQRDALPSEIDFILNDLRRPLEGRPGEILKDLYREAERDGFSTSGWAIKSARGLTARLEQNLDLIKTRHKVERRAVPGRTSVTWHITPILSDEEEAKLMEDESFYEDIF